MFVMLVFGERATNRAPLLLELVEPNPGLGDRLQPSQVGLVLLPQQVEPHLQLRQNRELRLDRLQRLPRRAALRLQGHHARLRGVALGESRLNQSFDSGQSVVLLGERAHRLAKLSETFPRRLQQAFEQFDLASLTPLRDL